MTQEKFIEAFKTSSDPPLSPLMEELMPLYDVTCEVAVVLGTGRMSVRQCLYLKPKTVIPLTQVAGSDLQLLVNGVPIATGEVAVLDDSAAVRLTHIVAPPSGGDAV